MTETDLRRFADHLRKTTSFKAKVVDWYRKWVREFAGFASEHRCSPWEDSALEAFLEDRRTAFAGWQLQQAQDAIERYRRFRLRLQHTSLRTEKTYVHWAGDFSRSLSVATPGVVDRRDVRRYLTELAVTRGVASSTQKQAFIAQLNDTPLLMCRLIYGGGLRLSECRGLRIQDLDLPDGAMTVRSGKWDKEQVTLPAARLQPELERHVAGVRRLFEDDRALDRPGMRAPRQPPLRMIFTTSRKPTSPAAMNPRTRARSLRP
ncbi:MAG: phage integrase N-terminal SAM-like domain-containing protein [Spirochaetaceae bacterium]